MTGTRGIIRFKLLDNVFDPVKTQYDRPNAKVKCVYFSTFRDLVEGISYCSFQFQF